METKIRPDFQELKAWLDEHEPKDKMVYKNGFWHSIAFIRDRLFQFPFWDLADSSRSCTLKVIGTHRSKSIILPVCKIEYVGRGLCNDVYFEMIVSYNFYQYSVTIRCNYAIPDMVKSLKLFDTRESCSCCLYGFNDEDYLGPYNRNQREFSCTVHDNYKMWGVMQVIKVWLENLTS